MCLATPRLYGWTVGEAELRLRKDAKQKILDSELIRLCTDDGLELSVHKLEIGGTDGARRGG